MRRIRKLLALGLVSAFLLTAMPFSASAAVQTKTISTAGYGTIGRQTTTETALKIMPVTDSQALHTKGYETTISVSSTKSTTATSSSSLTVGADFVFATMSASMGVSNSVSYSTGSSVSYKIAATTASGRYRIEHVFPSYKVKQEKVAYSAGGGASVTWSRTITTAPRTSQAYRRLSRYAGV